MAGVDRETCLPRSRRCYSKNVLVQGLVQMETGGMPATWIERVDDMTIPLYLVRRSALLSALLVGAIQAYAAAPAAAQETAPAVSAPAVFARVGDAVITVDEYEMAFTAAARSKFYHGKSPEGEVALLQREVADKMVTRTLLLREAQRRGIVPDRADIDKSIAGYDRRYANSEQWKKTREFALPALIARLEEDSLIGQLEAQARAVAEAPVDDVKAYYAANPDKFTEPERVRISTILIKVDPSSPKEDWDKASEEIKAIQKLIKDGGDFAALAKEHSKESSAANGGDMGYMHTGTVPPVAQEVLAALKPGEMSEPLRLLEGYALLKLTERVPAKLHDFERVQPRAKALLQRDLQDAAWSALIGELKKATPARVDESRFLPLTEKSDGHPLPK